MFKLKCLQSERQKNIIIYSKWPQNTHTEIWSDHSFMLDTFRNLWILIFIWNRSSSSFIHNSSLIHRQQSAELNNEQWLYFLYVCSAVITFLTQTYRYIRSSDINLTPRCSQKTFEIHWMFIMCKKKKNNNINNI